MPTLPPKLGKLVTQRTFSWKEMVIRQWGSEYAAPDHGVYVFSNGRRFDSTDLGVTGIYRPPGFTPTPAPVTGIELESGFGNIELESGLGIIVPEGGGSAPVQQAAALESGAGNIELESGAGTVDLEGSP